MSKTTTPYQPMTPWGWVKAITLNSILFYGVTVVSSILQY